MTKKLALFVAFSLLFAGALFAQSYAFGTLTSDGITVGKIVASDTVVLTSGSINSAACTSALTDTATGAATTDNLVADFNADPTGVTGFAPSATGILTIFKYITANTVNFKICNNTAGAIDPGDVTIQWRVLR